MKQLSYFSGLRNESVAKRSLSVCGYHDAKPRRKKIIEAFSAYGVILRKRAFDLYREIEPIDWDYPSSIVKNIILFDLKTICAGKRSGFNLTEFELENERLLNGQFLFLVRCRTTGLIREMTSREILEKCNNRYSCITVFFNSFEGMTECKEMPLD